MALLPIARQSGQIGNMGNKYGAFGLCEVVSLG